MRSTTKRSAQFMGNRAHVAPGAHLHQERRRVAAKPFNLVLTGLPPAYNVNLIQGVLTGTVTIPPFKGCGYNLDQVFTTSVSGPGNSVKISQAPICTPRTGGGCPPVKPGPGAQPNRQRLIKLDVTS